MKTLPILFLFPLIFSFLSCGDDDDDFKFNTKSLSQTKWSGIMTETSTVQDSKTSDVSIFFISETEGEYDVKGPNDINPINNRFSYSINGKILHIPGGITMAGQWLLTKFDNNEMVLELGTGGVDAYKAVLSLNRIK